MWPSLRSGDVACVEPLQEPPRPGQVVLARLGQALVVHRVRRWEGPRCVLLGDNARAEDPPLPWGRVLGRVGPVRRGGKVLGPERWDWGPRCWGRWRVALKRGWVALLGRRRG